MWKKALHSWPTAKNKKRLPTAASTPYIHTHKCNTPLIFSVFDHIPQPGHLRWNASYASYASYASQPVLQPVAHPTLSFFYVKHVEAVAGVVRVVRVACGMTYDVRRV